MHLSGGKGIGHFIRLKPVFALAACLSLAACSRIRRAEPVEPSAEPYVPTIVTGEIRAGIEKHIANAVEQGDGHFHVPFEGRDLKLKLVRVHVEYLASLAPNRHFACVDMASDDGQFYDIDFFMEGKPGHLTVTETTVHKLDGVPYYVWRQNEDKQWVRTSVDKASKDLLGVLTGRDAFEFRYQATLPELSGPARCWLPLAASDGYQNVVVKSISVPGRRQTLVDSAHGNRVLFLELGPEHSHQAIEIVYDVERFEKGAYDGDPAEAQKHLQPETLVPANAAIRAIAEKAAHGLVGDLMRARALYDHVMDEMRYRKSGEGWGRGDATFACDALSGNCTDYHSLFIGLARSIGIPARFAIGVAIPSERHDGGTDGYHCWAEFYADGKWYPVDISEADKFSALSMYYFGHHPANRFEFSRGRDLVLDPAPASGPINFLAYPLLEVEGQPQRVKTLFLFKRTARPQWPSQQPGRDDKVEQGRGPHDRQGNRQHGLQARLHIGHLAPREPGEVAPVADQRRHVQQDPQGHEQNPQSQRGVVSHGARRGRHPARVGQQPEARDGEAEPHQRQAGADPGEKGALGGQRYTRINGRQRWLNFHKIVLNEVNRRLRRLPQILMVIINQSFCCSRTHQK